MNQFTTLASANSPVCAHAYCSGICVTNRLEITTIPLPGTSQMQHGPSKQWHPTQPWKMNQEAFSNGWGRPPGHMFKWKKRNTQQCVGDIFCDTLTKMSRKIGVYNLGFLHTRFKNYKDTRELNNSYYMVERGPGRRGHSLGIRLVTVYCFIFSNV